MEGTGKTHAAGQMLVRMNSGILLSALSGSEGPIAEVMPSATSREMYVVAAKNATEKK